MVTWCCLFGWLWCLFVVFYRERACSSYGRTCGGAPRSGAEGAEDMLFYRSEKQHTTPFRSPTLNIILYIRTLNFHSVMKFLLLNFHSDVFMER